MLLARLRPSGERSATAVAGALREDKPFMGNLIASGKEAVASALQPDSSPLSGFLFLSAAEAPLPTFRRA